MNSNDAFSSWFNALITGVSTRIRTSLTVPHDIIQMPCGCEREIINSSRPGSTLKYPVTREFVLIRVKGQRQWRLKDCPHGAMFKL